MMLYDYLRLFTYDGATFTDISLDNQKQGNETTITLSTTNYLYVAQYYPTNNLFFYLGDTPNAAAANLKIEYWGSPQWREGVDLLDGTKTTTAPLSESGVLQFSPDREHMWTEVIDTTKNPAPDVLNPLTIYESYWMRISADAPITFTVKEISYALTQTERIDDFDVKISQFYNSFESGKTDWNREIITASKLVLLDLKRLGLVVHPGQILRFDDLTMAAMYKTLDLIYRNLGPSYDKKKMEVRDLYKESLNVKGFTFDLDNDAKVDKNEINRRVRLAQR